MGQGHADLLAVYETREEAEHAALAASRLGVPDDRIRVGDQRDQRPALEAEMRAEMEEGLVAPQAGLALPKEQAKAAGAGMFVGAIVGALVLLPFGFIPLGSAPLWGRLLIAALVGAAAGVTGTYVVGAAAARGPADPMAAERGVTVRVEDADQRVVDLLRRSEPIRLDVIGGEGIVDIRPAAQKEESTTDLVGDVAERLEEPEGDWRGARDNRRDQ